jgi:hypothetical protein
MEYKDKIRVRKYKDIIRRYDLSKIDYQFKLFCRRYSPCHFIDEGDIYYFKEMKRMTIGTIITNMLFQDLISDDGDIVSKMKLLIDDYITEELSEYCESYFDITTEKC